MKQVISTEKVPIKMWLTELEDGALQQAKNIANLPFIFKHLAIMPDSHQGYGMPIGGVLATKGVVIPNAVGVDIGCGMCSMRTNLNSIDKSQLQSIVDLIKERIPVGFNHQTEKQPDWLTKEDLIILNGWSLIEKEYQNSLSQLGTLGGGNHFIEIQKDNDGFVWIMVHSGSRNLGKRVADHYNKIAERFNRLWYSEVESSKELAFLPIETQEAKNYMTEMKYCVNFAFKNRKLMMDKIQECFAEVIPNVLFPTFNGNTITNIAHNYARWENHFGQNVIIHRKGATSANQNEIGIIPGSMGTKSYIVEGLGNPDSFMSCSHGAGRKMGRKQAQRELNLEHEIFIMDNQDIIHDVKTTDNLDEASGAYKDIDTVMGNQNDLVKILVELKPIAVIKG
jgi:tRNA-splicing ligase RtcB